MTPSVFCCLGLGATNRSPFPPVTFATTPDCARQLLRRAILVVEIVSWLSMVCALCLSTLGFFSPVGTMKAPVQRSANKVGTLGLELESSRRGVGKLDVEIEGAAVLVGTLSLELESSVRGVGSLTLELEDSPRSSAPSQDCPVAGSLGLELE